MKKKMLSPRQFAEKHSRKYTTVMTWLHKGQLKGAVRLETPSGYYWAIPADAAPPTRKRGRPKKGEKNESN